MPFGLKNAAQRFQRLMDRILDGLPWCFVYLDDVLLASKSMAEHRIHLTELFSILEKNGLVVNKDKCELGVTSLDFLGHRVTSEGVAPMPDRVADLQKYPTPTDKPSLQRFLGIVNYYHRFMPNIAQKLSTLHKAVGNKKGKTIEPQPRRNVLPRRFPGISEHNYGRHVVPTISYLERVEMVSPVMIQINFFEVDGVSY